MSNEIIKPKIFDLDTINNQESEFSLGEIKQTLYRQWKPALAIAIFAFTGIFLFTALKTPQYISETQILIDNSKTQQSTSISPIKEQMLTGAYSMKDLTTEILVLRSNPMVTKALENIKDEYKDLNIFEVLENLNIFQAALDEIPSDVIVVSYTDSDPERAKAVLEALGDTYVKYSLDKQRSQASNAIKFIDTQLEGSQQELDDAAKDISQFRQINQMVDPDISASEVANIKLSIEQEIQEVKTAIQGNKKQTQELNSQLAILGQDSETMIASSVLGQDGVYQNLATQLKEVETQYSLGTVNFEDTYYLMQDLKDRRIELKKLLQERAEQVLGKSVSPAILDRVVLSQVNVNSTANSSTADSSTANSSTANSSTADSSTADSSDTQNSETSAFKGNTFGTQGSGTKISAEGSTLGTLASRKLELQYEASALQSQLEGLNSSKAKLTTNFEQIPSLQRTYDELKRQLELKSNAYNYLLVKKQELEIDEAQEIAPWRVLNDPFLPTKPISPDILQSLLGAVVGGGFLGVGTAFVLQKMDQRIRLVEEIKEITRLPILGVIPKVETPAIEVNIHTTKRSYSYYSSFTEGLRSLAMNLRYLIIETGAIKTLAITSSTSAEGKTTLTYNLALVLAEFGLHILLVDADMRKPRIHKLAKLDNQTGLSDAITTEQPWSDFSHTGTVENLEILTSGPASPNPIALLSSDKMKQLIQEWQETYDYVLIDSPPVGIIADAKSLANQVDTMLFVAAMEKTNRKAISNALDILRSSQCNIGGIVANLVDPEFDYHAYSYYDSYYNKSAQNEGGDSSNEGESEGKIQNILQQFRRR
jgi:polysaccharide biosynthesis transport protein